MYFVGIFVIWFVVYMMSVKALARCALWLEKKWRIYLYNVNVVPYPHSLQQALTRP